MIQSSQNITKSIGFKFTKVLDGRTPCRILFTPDRKMFRSDQVQISRTRWKKGKRVLDWIQTDTLMSLSDWLVL